jgi:hypothetical protein
LTEDDEARRPVDFESVVGKGKGKSVVTNVLITFCGAASPVWRRRRRATEKKQAACGADGAELGHRLALKLHSQRNMEFLVDDEHPANPPTLRGALESPPVGERRVPCRKSLLRHRIRSQRPPRRLDAGT